MLAKSTIKFFEIHKETSTVRQKIEHIVHARLDFQVLEGIEWQLETEL